MRGESRWVRGARKVCVSRSGQSQSPSPWTQLQPRKVHIARSALATVSHSSFTFQCAMRHCRVYTCSCFSGRLCALWWSVLCTLQCCVLHNLVFSVFQCVSVCLCFSAANCETVQTDTVQTGKATLATKSRSGKSGKCFQLSFSLEMCLQVIQEKAT